MARIQISALTPEVIDQVIEEALSLLRSPGLRVYNNDALALLADAGASVDKQSQIVSIPEMLARQAVGAAPYGFSLYDLDGAPAIQFGGERVYFVPAVSAVSLLANEAGDQRTANTQDFIRFVRLVDALPQLDAQSTAFACRDVPDGIGDLYRLYLALNYLHKPIVASTINKESWRSMWEMLVLTAGGSAEFTSRPFAIFDISSTPPFTWGDLACQNLIDCARKGIPIQLVSSPIAGMTSPITLASAVVEHTAENLCGLLITQLARQGAPVVWGGVASVADMHTCAIVTGDSAAWLINAACVQVGKKLGLPTHTSMGASESKVVDAQAGLETSAGLLMAALSGANLVSGAGGLDFLRCQSFEKLVIDADAIGMVQRTALGIEAHETPIAKDKFRKSALKSDHFSSPHTQKWARKELYMPSDVIDRYSFDAWKQKGAKTAYQRATDRIEKLLKTSKPNRLSDKERAELRRITAAAAKRAGMDDLPKIS